MALELHSNGGRPFGSVTECSPDTDAPVVKDAHLGHFAFRRQTPVALPVIGVGQIGWPRQRRMSESDIDWCVGICPGDDDAPGGWKGGGMREAGGAAPERGKLESWLRIELESQGRTCTVVLHGALSDTSIAALQAQVDQLGCLPCDDVVVDASGLTALDAVGANVLLGLYHYVNGRGGTLRITGARGTIATALRQYAVEYAETDDGLTNAIDEAAGQSAAEPVTDLDGGRELLA